MTERANRSAYEPGAATLERRCCAAVNVLRRSIAIVIGPTPPGTGVISPATSAALRSTSPTSFPASSRFMATSMTTAPGFDHVRGHEPGLADGRDENVRTPRMSRQIGGPRVSRS